MTPQNAKLEIIQEVSINAPAERVFAALVRPEARVQWWGGKTFQVTHMESDLRPGGQWLMRGIGLEGKTVCVTGAYRQIEPPHVLSFSWLPDWQGDATETLVRWDLSETDGITTVRLTHSGFWDQSSLDSYRGWHFILGGLQAFVEGTRA